MTRTLQSEINAAARYELLFAAAEAAHQLPPVYITTHRRADKLDTLRNIPYLQEHATLVVAEQELDDYLAHWPQAGYLVIPEGYGDVPIGLGRANQFIMETAQDQGQEVICVIDDDLKAITALYSLEDGDRVSRARGAHVPDGRMGDFFLGCLVTMGLIAEEAFASSEYVVLASPQTNNADRRIGAASKRWALNQGGNPAQLRFIHVPRLMAMTGGYDPEFAQHGEDIALAADILAAGGSLADIPTFVTDWRDYELESTMRTPETAPALRAAEHESLMKKPLAKFIKTRYDMLDRPQWHSINWTALKRAGWTEPGGLLWTDPSSVAVEAPDLDELLAELI